MIIINGCFAFRRFDFVWERKKRREIIILNFWLKDLISYFFFFVNLPSTAISHPNFVGKKIDKIDSSNSNLIIINYLLFFILPLSKNTKQIQKQTKIDYLNQHWSSSIEKIVQTYYIHTHTHIHASKHFFRHFTVDLKLTKITIIG